jgi:hypothetical protein
VSTHTFVPSPPPAAAAPVLPAASPRPPQKPHSLYGFPDFCEQLSISYARSRDRGLVLNGQRFSRAQNVLFFFACVRVRVYVTCVSAAYVCVRILLFGHDECRSTGQDKIRDRRFIFMLC